MYLEIARFTILDQVNVCNVALMEKVGDVSVADAVWQVAHQRLS